MIAVRRMKIVVNTVLMLTASFATFYILTVVIPLLRGILKLADTFQKRKVILFYTTVFGAKPSTIWPTTSLDTCEVPCRISDDKSSLLQSDAVIFHGRDMPETMPTRRTTNQRWVYFVQENPHYTSPEPLKYNGMFNWTMTYKRSSDVWAPYGTYRTAEDNDLRRSYFSSGAGYFLFVFLLVAGVAKILESLSKEVLFTMPRTSIWTFFIIEQWFCPNFWINRLLESKEISRYKFEASCRIIEKASFPADLRHSKNAFA